VVRFGEDGAITYRHETGAAVRAVHLAQVDGSGERVLLAGGDDCAVTMLDGKGEVRWRREFIRSHYRDSHVNAVTTADLTGDGETEVLVATDGWLVWALTAEGEEVWHRQIRHHAARSLVVDDVEGDGKLEVLVGTEYHSSNMLEADREIRWSVGGGPSFTALAIADLNGDGVKEAFYGAMDGNVHAIDAASGEVLWRANLGDDVRFGQVLETEAGRCFLAGSDSGNVALVSGEGEKVWRRDLGEAVTGIAVLHGTDGGEDTIAAGTVDGRIVLISASGDVLGMQQTDSGITAMASADLGDQSGLIIGMDNGTLRALALK
jgi:outer membrane protein assembly factor BamB